jgi:ribosomal protein L37E
MRSRTYLPCRVCGDSHQNQQSSSICAPCGAEEAANNAAKRRDDERVQVANKYDSFEDIETVHEMKEWIREYIL